MEELEDALRAVRVLPSMSVNGNVTVPDGSDRVVSILVRSHNPPTPPARNGTLKRRGGASQLKAKRATD